MEIRAASLLFPADRNMHAIIEEKEREGSEQLRANENGL
jgi:hypothetical protein